LEAEVLLSWLVSRVAALGAGCSQQVLGAPPSTGRATVASWLSQLPLAGQPPRLAPGEDLVSITADELTFFME
jgi:hypothetical protein